MSATNELSDPAMLARKAIDKLDVALEELRGSLAKLGEEVEMEA